MPTQKIDNVSLYYELQGSGTPLVLLHGLQGDSSNFADLVPALARQHQVLVFDQRGSGWSDKPEQPYSMALYADDTARLMDALGIERAHVLGMSMGGMIAQEFALRHPNRLNGLVLGCTSPGGPNAAKLESAARERTYETAELSAEERAYRLAEAGLSQGFLRRNRQVLKQLTEARRQRPLDVNALQRRMAAIDAHDTFDRLGDIQAPTLVITGRPDSIVSADNSTILAERIPNARLEVLEPAGHLFWLEKPRETLDLVLAFLGERRP
ncbi:MAG TPA: alpha/beta fold hydrolase [Gammaproteobacteria bacterium]|nr:alpha/beta fold hydrolase [Gammaproteobacteria bacterium]